MLLALEAGCHDWSSLSSLLNGSVPHVGPAAQAGTEDLVLHGETIDTSALTVGGAAAPRGIAFEAVAQVPTGPEPAVLRTRGFAIASGAVVRAVGARPLVIIAGGDISIAGVLAAGGMGAEPGAGGALPGTGAGLGSPGTHLTSGGMDRQGGGGGGGFGT